MAVTNYYVKVELDPCDIPYGNQLVIYDSSSSQFKLVSKNDREGNICYEDQDNFGFKNLTIALDPNIYPEGVSGSFNHIKIQCDASTTQQNQSTRTILVWDNSGEYLVASTIEDARYPDNSVLHDIKRLTGSFDATGSLVFQPYQFNVLDVKYCLKYELL